MYLSSTDPEDLLCHIFQISKELVEEKIQTNKMREQFEEEKFELKNKVKVLLHTLICAFPSKDIFSNLHNLSYCSRILGQEDLLSLKIFGEFFSQG